MRVARWNGSSSVGHRHRYVTRSYKTKLIPFYICNRPYLCPISCIQILYIATPLKVIGSNSTTDIHFFNRSVAISYFAYTDLFCNRSCWSPGSCSSLTGNWSFDSFLIWFSVTSSRGRVPQSWIFTLLV